MAVAKEERENPCEHLEEGENVDPPLSGWTRSSNNSIFLFEIFQFFVRKYSTFIYTPQALLESEKMSTLSVSLTLYTECEEIQA